MKKNFYRNIVSLALVISGCCFSTNTLAQVTVGAVIAPVKGSLLQIKDTDPNTATDPLSSTNNVTATKGGLLLPRVKLLDFTSLNPLVTGTPTDSEKMALAGAVVYNVNTITGTNLVAGLYVWTGTEWNKLLFLGED